MSHEIYKTNSALDLDPDWGKTDVPVGSIFKISVSPMNRDEKTWQFYVLFPKVDELESLDYDETEITDDICDFVLEKGDQYEVSEVTDQDTEQFDRSIPLLLCYDPRDEEGEGFVWLTPPRSIRH